MDKTTAVTGPFSRLTSLQGRLGRQVKMWAAYLWFCIRESGLRSAPASVAGKDILMVSISDWPERIKMEGVIAKSLQCKGSKITVMTYRNFRWAVRYFRAFGVTDFVYLDDLQAEAEKALDPKVTDTIIADHKTFDALYRFEQHGINIGKHVLSTIIRQMKNGSPEFSDPEVVNKLRTFIPQSLRAAKAAEILFSRIHPHTVLFLEKGYTPYGEIFETALRKNIPAIQYHHGQRAELIVMKRYSQQNLTHHPFSLSANSWQKVRALPWHGAEEEAFMQELKDGYEKGSWMNRKFLLNDKKLKTPDEVRQQLGLDPSKKTAVIFSHVLWDATFFFGTNLFKDYEVWLIETVRAACENTNVNWIIKVHPDYAWKMKEVGLSKEPRDTIALAANVGKLPDHIKLVLPDIDISTYAFFPITDYCITVRGTIGIEAPCFGIPVITAGTGRYSGLGFTNDSATREEYLQKIRTIQNIPALSKEETSLARRHAYALFHLRPLPMLSFEMKPVVKKDKAFDHHTEVRVHSGEDIKNASDLTAFAHWVLDSKDEDYLHLPN